MTSSSMIRLVMSREIHQRLRSRSFAITTIVLCVGVIGAGILSRVLQDDGSPAEYDIAVVGELPPGFDEIAHQVARDIGVTIDLRDAAERSAADRLVRDGDVDAAVDVNAVELVSADEPSDELAAVVNSAWQGSLSRQAAQDAGLEPGQIDTIMSPAALEPALLEASDDDDDTARLIGMITTVVLFISINAFGGLVLTGVVEEKTTGVVEVLLAHVRAHQLLAGKVFGIGAVAMAQMAATVAAGLVALRISGHTMPTEVWVGLPTSLLWFLLGFVLYSTLFALAGSFVSRMEDAQSAAAPISLLFTVGYMAVFLLGATPQSTVSRVISVLPPFAPLLMPVRVAVGAASVVEITVAAVGLLLTTFAMLRLAGSVYGHTLLHRGSRLQWRQALRMRS
jgi:ABC-2 type transport system permease protein